MSKTPSGSPSLPENKGKIVTVSSEATPAHFLVDLINGESDDIARDFNKIIDRFKLYHQRCQSSLQHSLRHAIDCGRMAVLLRADCGHGDWTKTFQRRYQPKLGVSLRSVERYINVYERFQIFASQSAAKLQAEDEETHTEKLLSAFQAKQRDDLKNARTDPNEYQTPAIILDAVTSFLEKIDCDPCVNDTLRPDRKLVPISYSRDDGSNGDGGLSKDLPWSGRCWIAPGHKGDFSRWVQKAINELKLGEMKEALMLLPSHCLSSVELLSFDFVAISEPLTIPASGKKGTRQQVIRERMLLHYLSLSPNRERFATVFGSLGTIFTRFLVSPTAINESRETSL